MNQTVTVDGPEYRKIAVVIIGLLLISGFLYISMFGGPYSH